MWAENAIKTLKILLKRIGKDTAFRWHVGELQTASWFPQQSIGNEKMGRERECAAAAAAAVNSPEPWGASAQHDLTRRLLFFRLTDQAQYFHTTTSESCSKLQCSISSAVWPSPFVCPSRICWIMYFLLTINLTQKATPTRWQPASNVSDVQSLHQRTHIYT